MSAKMWVTLAVGLGVWATAGTAAAQQGCATCGTAGLAGGAGGGSANTGPWCTKHGLKIFPLSEKNYIKQFCAPTICPGSCFGHYRTQWTPWGAACPNWPSDTPIHPAGLAAHPHGLPAALPPAQQPPAGTMPPPTGGGQSAPLAEPKQAPPTAPAPTPLKDMGKPPMPPAPGTPGEGRGSAPAQPGVDPRVTLPAIPDLPAAGSGRF